MCRPVVHRAKRARALILLHRTIPLAAGQHKCTRLKAAMKRDTIDWLICDLKEQAGLLNVSLSSWGEKPTDLEVLLLKKPSLQKYVIYRCLWNSGFNPTQHDWVYNYIFWRVVVDQPRTPFGSAGGRLVLRTSLVYDQPP